MRLGRRAALLALLLPLPALAQPWTTSRRAGPSSAQIAPTTRRRYLADPAVRRTLASLLASRGCGCWPATSSSSLPSPSTARPWCCAAPVSRRWASRRPSSRSVPVMGSWRSRSLTGGRVRFVSQRPSGERSEMLDPQLLAGRRPRRPLDETPRPARHQIGPAMRISAIQMNQTSDKQANLDQARRLIEGALAADRPDMVTQPETWTNLGGGARHGRSAAEVLPEPGGTAARPMSSCAASPRARASMCMAARSSNRGRRSSSTRLWSSTPTGRENRALTQDPSVRHHGPGRHRLSRERALRRGSMRWSPSRRRREVRLHHLLRHCASPSNISRCGGRGRSDPGAVQLHADDRQGPLGGAAARAGIETQCWVHRRRLLGRL